VQVAGPARDVAVDEAVGDARRRAGLVGAADVLDDPDVPVAVVLDARAAAATERAGDVLDGRRERRRRGVGRRGRALRRQEQALRERIPGRAVDRGDRLAGRVPRRHQRHAMLGVGVEADAGDVAVLGAVDGGRRLVALEEEVRAVVVAGVGPRLVAQDEIGVLVGLGLLGLGRRAGGRRHHLRERGVVGAVRVVLVAVPADDAAGVLPRGRSLRPGDLLQAAGEAIRRRVACGALVGGRDGGRCRPPRTATRRPRWRWGAARDDRRAHGQGAARSLLLVKGSLLVSARRPDRRRGERAGR